MSNKIAEIVTSKILGKLDQGVIPWRKSWTVSNDLARNAVTNKVYRGINVWLLMFEGFNNPFWLTFKQVTDLGGTVKKGSKSQMIIFWNIKVFEDKNKKGETVAKKIPMLKYYNVFNVSQTEGCKFPKHVQDFFDKIGKQTTQKFTPIERAENIVTGYMDKPSIEHINQHRAYYQPKRDLIVMPPKESFDNENYYYATLFHELGHSTGAEKRLNRATLTDGGSFGSHEYSKEELVAEMTSSFLLANAGIDNEQLQDNSVAYIQSWLVALKNDTNLFLSASQLAQRATDYILGEVISNQLDEALELTEVF